VSAVHWTHAPSPEQIGVVVPAQSVLVTHCWQCEAVRLQCGAAAGHCASLVQPARHSRSRLQMGAEVPQSAFERHATQVWVPRKHRGVPPLQSAFDSHSTHCCVVGSQTRAPPGQSAEVLHPTQAPVVASQTVAPPRWQVAVVELHAGWQVWSPGKQAGAFAGQFALLAHWTQAPATQYGAAAAQFALLVHSTHPSVGSHCRFCPHEVPQAATPPAPTFVPPPLPPQATARNTVTIVQLQPRQRPSFRKLLMTPTSYSPSRTALRIACQTESRPNERAARIRKPARQCGLAAATWYFR
jgi:hypothetical protein